MNKNTAPVVITRKDKRIRHKLTHLLAFGLTGGASGIVTAAEAANHASYNARTRKLQAEADSASQPPAPRRRGPKPEITDEDRAYFAAHVPAEHRRSR